MSVRRRRGEGRDQGGDGDVLGQPKVQGASLEEEVPHRHHVALARDALGGGGRLYLWATKLKSPDDDRSPTAWVPSIILESGDQ